MTAPTANTNVQPLRLLNAATAQASANGNIKWQVKITEGELSSFTYEHGAKKLYVFWCTLVGDSPAVYVRGVYKHSNEQTVKDIASRFQDGLMFHMSKVAFDQRQNVEFLSGPIKQVVLMAPQTLFEPILAGSLI